MDLIISSVSIDQFGKLVFVTFISEKASGQDNGYNGQPTEEGGGRGMGGGRGTRRLFRIAEPVELPMRD